MEQPGFPRRHGKQVSYERPLALILTLLAILSPLYIDRRTEEEEESDELSLGLTFLLPLLLLVVIVVIVAVSVSCYLDQRLTQFDPYWIHRVGGSSGGLIVILTLLLVVPKCKASV